MKSKKLQKRVFIVSTSPIPIYLFLKNHINQLHKYYHISLITNTSSTILSDKKVNFDDFYFIPIKRKIHILYDLYCLIYLTLIFFTKKPDLIWNVNPKAGLLGAISSYICKINSLFVFQGEVWANKKSFSRLILKECDKILIKLTKNVFAVSNGEKIFLDKEMNINKKKIKVLNNGSISGVNTSLFKFDSRARELFRNNYQIDPTSIVIGFVGRVCKDKGVISLYLTFKKLLIHFPNLTLILIGSDEEHLIKNKILKLDNNFIHIKHSENIEKILPGFDIFCLPSEREGLPISILEASSCEIPILGSNIYGVKDCVLNRKTGLLYNDTQDLYKKLQILIKDKNLRGKYGNAGRKFIMGSFDQKVVVKRYVEEISKIMKLA